MSVFTSRGKVLWDTLRENLRAFQRGPVAGARTREVIWGVSAKGTFVNGMTFDGFLAKAGKLLLDSGRIYRWQDTLCFEVNEADDQQLFVIASRQKAEPSATSILSNLFCVGVQGEENSSQSLLPSSLVNALLADQDLWRRLPAIRYYTKRPIFDDDFNLCGPGWNAGRGILVHGPDIEPNLPPPKDTPGARVMERLPPYLGRLLRDFCWASDADLTNAVGMVLTGFLANHFVTDPKPICILDGNQKGLGKTLLIQVAGHLLDDAEPPRIPLVRDEELEKKLCAQLREARSSIFFFDNVRNRVDSPLIEANALSPVLSFRILGQSGNISRPNAFLWALTSNQASGTEDLISRGLPIRLRYEGNPRERTFGENLLDYCRKYRLEMLGELAGMVLRWKEAGKPPGTQKHRCVRWAEVIGGILGVANLDGFLANVEEAEAAMDEGLLALSTLAEHVVARGLSDYFGAPGSNLSGKGRPASDWAPLFTEGEVFREQLANKSPKGRATWVGNFLGSKTDRKVSITTLLGSGTATLRKQKGRANQTLYFFETVIEEDRQPGPAPGEDGQEKESTVTSSGHSNRTPPAATTPPPALQPQVSRRSPWVPVNRPPWTAGTPAGGDGAAVGDGLEWV